MVGGGISGLSAAYFFRKTLGGPRSRVLGKGFAMRTTRDSMC